MRTGTGHTTSSGRRDAPVLEDGVLGSTSVNLPGNGDGSSGVVTPRHRVRRRRRLLVVVGAVIVVIGAGGVIGTLLARAQLESGLRHANAGLAAARAGDGGSAADHFDAASRAFDAAHDQLDAWWATPGLAMPVVSQQVRAVTSLAHVGAELTSEAAAATREARIDELEVREGQLDLAHVRAMATSLGSIQRALEEAAAAVDALDVDGLLPPVIERIDELAQTLAAAQDDAADAGDALAVLPELLGSDGRRFYFVAFGTPAEARELGGFMGAYAVLAAEDGRLSLAGSGRVRDLNRAFRGKQLSDPSQFPPQYLAMQPQRYWQNITGTADFPTVAEAVRQLWPAKALPPLDGVLYLEPHALAAMLELTGPVRVSGREEPLTADTAAAFLLHDQYVEFPDDDRHDFLLEAATTVFEKLTTGDLAESRDIVDALGPSTREGRLLFHSFQADEQAVIEDLGIGGVFPPVRGDFVSVRASNLGLNKVDAMVQRSVRYDVAIDPATGSAQARLEITIRNESPSSGLPRAVIENRNGRPAGTSSTALSVYTPFELVSASQDGVGIDWGELREYDRRKYLVLVDVPPMSEVTVTFALKGYLDLSAGYHLDVIPQTLANPDALHVRVRAASGRLIARRDEKSQRASISVDIPIGRLR